MNGRHLERTQFGHVVLTGWIGENPNDGGDFSMLMAYGLDDGAQTPAAALAARRELVANWGLLEGVLVENPIVQSVPVIAVLDGTVVTVTGFPGLDLTRPTSDEWASIARRRGQIFFSFTTRAWPGGPTADEDAVQAFAADERTINSATHMLLPVH